MDAFHFVARCERPHAPLLRARAAVWLLDRLRELVPEPLAVVLMPNHLHVLTRCDDPVALRYRLARLLGHWRRRFGPEGFAWQAVPAAELVSGLDKIQRGIRYVSLNPCRAGLCKDPLDWVPSTHRDHVGATAIPWLDREGLARLIGDPSRPEVRARHHARVSADPSACVAGTPFPVPARPVVVAERPLAELAAASASALRGLPGDVRLRGPTRALFVGLAARHGWRQPKVLAEACEASPRTVRRLLETPLPASALAAAELCLGDSRCRSFKGLELDEEWMLSRPEGRRAASVGSGSSGNRATLLERLQGGLKAGHSR